MRTRSSRVNPTLKDERRLGWYAAVWDTPTVVYDYRQPGDKERTRYTEVVRAGSFAEALAGTAEVLANVDHDPLRTFAKRSDGTLLLQEDGFGLYASCWLPDTALGNEVRQLVLDGALDGGSFRFTPVRQRWIGDTCELQAVAIADVCLTSRPAYPATQGEVHLRSNTRTAELIARLRLIKLKTSQLDKKQNRFKGDQ